MAVVTENLLNGQLFDLEISIERILLAKTLSFYPQSLMSLGQ